MILALSLHPMCSRNFTPHFSSLPFSLSTFPIPLPCIVFYSLCLSLPPPNTLPPSSTKKQLMGRVRFKGWVSVTPGVQMIGSSRNWSVGNRRQPRVTRKWLRVRGLIPTSSLSHLPQEIHFSLDCTLNIIEDKPLPELGVGVQSLRRTESKCVAGRSSQPPGPGFLQRKGSANPKETHFWKHLLLEFQREVLSWVMSSRNGLQNREPAF